MVVVDIRNELRSSINYCQSIERPSCERVIKAGDVSRGYYVERGSEFVYSPRMFKDFWVGLCGAPVRLDQIISINPVIEKEERVFEIVIDQKVYREFCSR